MSDGGAEESEEGSSERSTAHARKKAKLSETPDASLVSKPDPHFSQLVHMLEEMDRHAAATDACEVRHRAATCARVLVHARGALKGP